MIRRALFLAVAAVAVFGSSALASDSFSGAWMSEIVIDTSGPLFETFDSALELRYALGDFVATSRSEIQLSGWIWQAFGVTEKLGAFDLLEEILFGASTADFLYGQVIMETTVAGVDVGFYAAKLSSAVFGGPEGGCVLRLAADTSAFHVESATEFGATLDGITIVHAATGSSEHYTTNPLNAGLGFTGQEIAVSELSFGCVDGIAATLYFTCAGFDSLTLEVAEIQTTLPWLSLDAELRFELQTKSLVVVPHLSLGQVACVDLYADLAVSSGGSPAIEGIALYGIGLTCSWNGVTLRDLSVFDLARYAITTPEYGSVIELIADAIEEEHEYYPHYWEMLSIDVELAGCCGGSNHIALYVYFDQAAGSLFDWAMTSVEATVALGASLQVSGGLSIEAGGSSRLSFGLRYAW